MQLASISERGAAFNVDILLFMLMTEVFQRVLEKIAPGGNHIYFVAYVLATAVYFCWPTLKYGQTLGKKMMHLRVVSAAGVEVPLTAGQVFIRELPGKFIASAPLFLGYLWAYTNDEKKTWHDSLAKTRVVTLLAEDERTFLTYLKKLLINLATAPLGVLLVLWLMLYTAAPLDTIKSSIEAAGTQVGEISGSLCGGLKMSELSRHDADQNYSLKDVEVKFDLWPVLTQRMFVLDKVTAQSGELEVPENFTWSSLVTNILAMSGDADADTDEAPGIKFHRFRFGLFEVRKLRLKHAGALVTELEHFAVRGFEKNDDGWIAQEAEFEVRGFKALAKDVHHQDGRTETDSINGMVTPELAPWLLAPMDFRGKGSFAPDFSKSTFAGSLFKQAMKFTYCGRQLTINAEKFPLSQLVKSSLPLQNFNMRWSGEGESVLELLMKQNVEYRVSLCGAEFSSTPGTGVPGRAGSLFRLSLGIKPVRDLVGTLTAKTATFDDLFEHHLTATNARTPNVFTEVAVPPNVCSLNPFAPAAPPGK